jgi:hypothetical protein
LIILKTRDNLIPMTNQEPVHLFHPKVLEITSVFCCLFRRQKKATTCFFNRLNVAYYNLFTGFPQKLWKTSSRPALFRLGCILLCCTFLFSCTFFKSSKKDAKPGSDAKTAQESKAAADAKAKGQAPAPKKGKPFLDNSLIDQGEDEVKKKFGEPDIVSKTPENIIIWTYKPKWKLLPDNTDTVYVEFENGKVRKIVRATR